MQTIPRLSTQRLRLRAIFPNDESAILKLFGDPEVARWYEFEPLQKPSQARKLIQLFTRWFQEDRAVRWGIVRKEDDQLIGTCCFDTFRVDYCTANIGYNLRSDFRRQGYTSEAVIAILSYAFEHGLVGPIHRVQAQVVPDNQASRRLLEVLGFQYEGTLRQAGFWKGQFHDFDVLGLLRPDWQERAKHGFR